MEYISSDTNAWIDFFVIHKTELPFRLPYTFLMETDMVDDELLSPDNMKNELLRLGLIRTELTNEEFLCAQELAKYVALSVPDRVALAIAKSRGITLLTGDKALRNAAIKEKVNCIGTIGILDQLLQQSLISTSEYVSTLLALREHNGKEIRLPDFELTQRINKCMSMF